MEDKYINKIMEETCFGLAYCCSLEKECDSRDAVIKKLGLTKKDFIELKEKFNIELFRKLKNKSPRKKTTGSRKQRGKLLQE
ncbi:MAG: hypothetical protein PHF86_12455 [Candidatus Nanoarchaeia archaeon]|nr:hypothetical protein [Candidatus Nanoarchaeia archaeon]